MRYQGSFSLFGENPSGGGSAEISDDGRYRYSLTREWGAGKQVCFIGLNPSTADATLDDPTIRRCVAFAKREGGKCLLMLNLFSLRSTDPAALLGAPNPIGEPPEELAARWGGAGLIVAAWGAVHRSLAWRVDQVRDLIATDGVPVMCLGFTKDGSPRHPLYVRGDAPLLPWPTARLFNRPRGAAAK